MGNIVRMNNIFEYNLVVQFMIFSNVSNVIFGDNTFQ